MPRYFFSIDHGDHCHDDETGTELRDDDAARDYARRVIRELIEGGGYDDPRLAMTVTDGRGREIAVIHFQSMTHGHGGADDRARHDGGTG
jgi:hypothetical protein